MSLTTVEKTVSIKPLADRVVVAPAAAEERTAGGLIIPDTAKEKPQEGKVVAVGTGRVLDNGERVSLEVSVGDRIIFSKYAGTEVKYEGTTKVNEALISSVVNEYELFKMNKDQIVESMFSRFRKIVYELKNLGMV